MTDDKKTKEASGEYIVKPQDIEHIPSDLARPTSGVVSSAATSFMEQQRLKQVEKETAGRVRVAKQKTELNVAMSDLAESEIHKEIALENLKNLPAQVARGQQRREMEEEGIDLDLDTELEQKRRANAKAKRKRLEEERRLREEEEGG